jgi:hypothetical protein
VFQNCTILCEREFKFTNCYFKDKSITLQARGKLVKCHFDDCDLTIVNSTVDFNMCGFNVDRFIVSTSTISLYKSIVLVEVIAFNNSTVSISKCDARSHITMKYCTTNLYNTSFTNGFSIMSLENCIGEIIACDAAIEDLVSSFTIIGCSLKIDDFRVKTKSITIKPIMLIKSSMLQCFNVYIEEWPEVPVVIESSTVYFTNLQTNSHKNVICTDSFVHFNSSAFHSVNIDEGFSVNAENSSIKLIDCKGHYPVLLDNSTCVCIKYTGEVLKMVNGSSLKCLNSTIKNIFIEKLMYDYEHIMSKNTKIVKDCCTIIQL